MMGHTHNNTCRCQQTWFDIRQYGLIFLPYIVVQCTCACRNRIVDFMIDSSSVKEPSFSTVGYNPVPKGCVELIKYTVYLKRQELNSYPINYLPFYCGNQNMYPQAYPGVTFFIFCSSTCSCHKYIWKTSLNVK